jgi:type VI protein secretion system component Hcp
MPIAISMEDLSIEALSFSLAPQHGLSAPAQTPIRAQLHDCQFTKKSDKDSAVLFRYAMHGKHFDKVTVTFSKATRGPIRLFTMLLKSVVISYYLPGRQSDDVGLDFESIEILDS